MTKLEANQILDLVKAGSHYHEFVINQALQCTGDLCRNIDPLPNYRQTKRVETLRLVTPARVRKM